MSNPFSEQNPYQSPAVVAPSSMPGQLDRDSLDKLKKFQQQIIALGGLWIILSLLALGLGGFLLANPAETPPGSEFLVPILLVSGVLHLTIGVMSCLKQIWAVYVGLVISYISVIGNLISLNLCALVILAVVIVQAHRVIGWARELKARGIPLNTKA
jgi:hypothetical protein